MTYIPQTIDSLGIRNVKPNNLSIWRAGVARQTNAEGHINISLIGDSITYGYIGPHAALPALANQETVNTRAMPARLRALFNEHYGYAGSGWAWVFTSNTYPDSRFSVSGATALGGSIFGRTGLQVTGTAQSFTFTPHDDCDKLVLYYLTGPSLGQFTASFDGGAAVTIDSNAVANGTGSYTYNSVGRGKHFVTVTGVASHVGVVVAIDAPCGSYGVRVASTAVQGMTAGDLVTGDQTHPHGSLRQAFDIMQPHLSVINYMANDWAQQVALATYKSNMQAIITRAKMYGDVLLVATVPQNLTGKAIPLSDYTNILYQLSAENNVPILDFQKRWTSYAHSNQSAVGYYVGDDIHPNFGGLSDMALTIYGAITDDNGLPAVSATNRFKPRFIDLALFNGWTNYDTTTWNPAGFYKEPHGRVQLRGLIKGGTTTAGTKIASLPEGYRPHRNCIFPVVTASTSDQFGEVRVLSNGDVTLNVTAGNTFVSLDSISFAITDH